MFPPGAWRLETNGNGCLLASCFLATSYWPSSLAYLVKMPQRHEQLSPVLLFQALHGPPQCIGPFSQNCERAAPMEETSVVVCCPTVLNVIVRTLELPAQFDGGGYLKPLPTPVIGLWQLFRCLLQGIAILAVFFVRAERPCTSFRSGMLPLSPSVLKRLPKTQTGSGGVQLHPE
jgi:hypothetical protein